MIPLHNFLNKLRFKSVYAFLNQREKKMSESTIDKETSKVGRISLQPRSHETATAYQRRVIETYEKEAIISPSRIKDAGNGVFAPCATPANVILGYYAGKQISHMDAEEKPSAYILEVAHNTNLERCRVIPLAVKDQSSRKSILIDASDRSVSNWCSMVNDYRGSGKKPNVYFRRNGAIVTITPLRKGEELLLDYGEDYWKAMSRCSQLRSKYGNRVSCVPVCEDGSCAMESSDAPVKRKRVRNQKPVTAIKVSKVVGKVARTPMEVTKKPSLEPLLKNTVKKVLKPKPTVSKSYTLQPLKQPRKQPSLFSWQ
jgi:hypothetical protein